MAVSAAAMEKFYRSPAGKRLACAVARGFMRYHLPHQGETLIAYGYTQPYLSAFAAECGEYLAFMPAIIADKTAAQDAQSPEAKADGSAAEAARQSPILVAESHKFPLGDASADCLLVIHGLEFSPDPLAQLREFWRILVPNGRLILAVPNRRGLWAHSEKTPLGYGQPYSRGQLAELLSQNGFDFADIYEEAHFPPGSGASLGSRLYEKIAARFFPYFGGILIVEAKKRLYNPLLKAAAPRRLIFMPDFSPASLTRRPTGGRRARLR